MFFRLPHLGRGGLLAGLLVVLSSSTAMAEPASKGRSIGFSRLVVRPKKSASVSIMDDGAKLLVLDELRAKKLNAVGGESVVFGQDRTADADLLLGGTVTQLDCETGWSRANKVVSCRLLVEWEVLDTRSETVAYRHPSWFVLRKAPADDSDAVAKSLVKGAVDELVARPAFLRLLEAPSPSKLEAASVAEAELEACSTRGLGLPKDSEAALDAVATLEVGKGHGSGFFLNKSGFLLTAAHVANHGKVRVKLRSGLESDATVVRMDERADVALLRLDRELEIPGCLKVAASAPEVGSALFAMGAPASKELGFSVTQGILSGVRLVDGVALLQTDASVSPGSSGGALADSKGVAVGVISRKLVGGGSEGLGFAVSTGFALSRLGIRVGSKTSELLHREVAVEKAPESEVIEDPVELMPSLDPEKDLREAQKQQERAERAEAERREAAYAKARSDLTPWYVPTLRWGGVGLFSVGGVVAIATGLGSNPNQTESDYMTKRTWNDVSWIAMGTGLGCFIVSFPLAPSEEDVQKKLGSMARIGFEPGRVSIEGKF